MDCIEIVPGPEHPDFMKLVEVDLERCIGCQLCARYCPWETIFMWSHDEGMAVAPTLHGALAALRLRSGRDAPRRRDPGRDARARPSCNVAETPAHDPELETALQADVLQVIHKEHPLRANQILVLAAELQRLGVHRLVEEHLEQVRAAADRSVSNAALPS